MKQITTLLLTIFLTSAAWGQTCYENTTPISIAMNWGIGQYFDACASGDLLTIEMKLSELATNENQVVVRVYDDFNSEVGIYYVPNLNVYTEALNPPLDNVIMVIQCNPTIVEGTRYRIDISSEGSFFAANGNGWLGVAFNMAQDYILIGEEGSTYFQIPAFSSDAISETNPYGYAYKVWQMESKDIEMKISISTSICVGDCDGDGYIGIADVLCLIDEYGKSCTDQVLYMDLNGDCTVDDLDLQLFKINYGHFCVQN